MPQDTKEPQTPVNDAFQGGVNSHSTSQQTPKGTRKKVDNPKKDAVLVGLKTAQAALQFDKQSMADDISTQLADDILEAVETQTSVKVLTGLGSILSRKNGAKTVTSAFLSTMQKSTYQLSDQVAQLEDTLPIAHILTAAA